MGMFEDLVAHGVQDLLQREYGDALQATPEVNFSVKLKSLLPYFLHLQLKID